MGQRNCYRHCYLVTSNVQISLDHVMGYGEKDRPTPVGLKLRKSPVRWRPASQAPISDVGRFGGYVAWCFVGGLTARRGARIRQLHGQAVKRYV